MADFETVWHRIEQRQGEEFRQKRGAVFTYKIIGGHLIRDRTNHQIPKSHFAKALHRWPVDGPGHLQDLRGPSYIYGVLSDRRIQSR